MPLAHFQLPIFQALAVFLFTGLVALGVGGGAVWAAFALWRWWGQR